MIQRDRAGRLVELRNARGRVVWSRSTTRSTALRRPRSAGDRATLYLYDEIGPWGVSAAEWVPELDALDVGAIDLRVSSPGGDCYDAMAMFEAIRRHPATVTAHVDGLAASAASFVMLAADTVAVAEHAEVMVHDAWGVCVGNADDMGRMRADLNRVSDNISSIYAEAAGGTSTAWRRVMKGERWYTSTEAVAAGLADHIGDEGDDQGDDVTVTDEELAAALASLHRPDGLAGIAASLGLRHLDIAAGAVREAALAFAEEHQ